MSVIRTVAELEALYGETSEASIIKVSDRLTEGYSRLIEASPIVALATSGPEGIDCSPRGDPGQVVSIRDERTLVLPDRRGNNRIDSLRNIVRDGRVALLFLIPGSDSTLRVNGGPRFPLMRSCLPVFPWRESCRAQPSSSPLAKSISSARGH
jgi:predicted pyridoxine 5'-phosphate oxidase superfamily flavin-nucleotide-binding protein